MSLTRRLVHGSDADRVLAAAIDPLYDGATAREIAATLGLAPEYVAGELSAIADERGVSELLAEAERVRARLAELPASVRPDVSSAVALLSASLRHVEHVAASRAQRLAQRALTGRTAITGGTRPPEQSRGALGA